MTMQASESKMGEGATVNAELTRGQGTPIGCRPHNWWCVAGPAPATLFFLVRSDHEAFAKPLGTGP